MIPLITPRGPILYAKMTNAIYWNCKFNILRWLTHYVVSVEKIARILYYSTTKLFTFRTARQNIEFQVTETKRITKKSILSVSGVSGVPHDDFMPSETPPKGKILTKLLFCTKHSSVPKLNQPIIAVRRNLRYAP